MLCTTSVQIIAATTNIVATFPAASTIFRPIELFKSAFIFTSNICKSASPAKKKTYYSTFANQAEVYSISNMSGFGGVDLQCRTSLQGILDPPGFLWPCDGKYAGGAL